MGRYSMKGLLGMSNTAYGSTLATGITLTTTGSPEPSRVPRGLIVTRAVELKDGWVGQVVVGDKVVRENSGFGTSDSAETWATQLVLDTLAKLFRG